MLTRMRCAVGALMLALASLLFAGLPAVAQPTPPAAEEAKPPAGVPVTLHGKELFRVTQDLGAYSAEERARAISERLRVLAETPGDSLPPVVAEEFDGITVISCGPTRILSVTEADARAAGLDRAAYARQQAEILGADLDEEQRQFSWRALLQGLAMAILATLALYAFFRVSRRVLRALIRAIVRLKHNRISD
ncbi:MAG: hypothetical protein KIT83_21765, partial [Bryobacterales bacterium]|nr:hypothetical protein [Bryobacterales bacterium]